jgi:hypothetical protein
MEPSGSYVAALKELGQSLGVISLGRKIVLIEGDDSSIDKDTYGAIVQEQFPEFVLTSSGSRQTILSFQRIVEEVLDKTMWGIEFYMLADRDNSLPDSELARLEESSKGRLKFLPRYHLENYFLDEDTISDSFANIVKEDEWIRKPEQVRSTIVDLARKSLPLAVNIWIGTYSRRLTSGPTISVKDCANMNESEYLSTLEPLVKEEITSFQTKLDPELVRKQARYRWEELEKSLENGSDRWKVLFPGKILVSRFCNLAKIEKGHFRHLYISQARDSDFIAFSEVTEIFKVWKEQPNAVASIS